MRKVSGFTLIELIAVILILGILAAVAVPQVVDLRSSARLATVQGVAGALASGSALNYANKGATGGGVSVGTCNASLATLVGGALPDNIVLESTGTTISAGTAVACTLSYSGASGTTAIANVIGA